MGSTELDLVSKTRKVNQRSFPKGFVFGTTASTHQVGGMTLKGGRGLCIQDTFVRIPGK
ncbi:hypothetical protein Cni_G06621 [Canna indica]|uniref:Uncharacterized protein n=1 Tax=Canna indica TaxID=4628 RepID=A0AAQ3Q4Y5_9LILI|nr:hypothetical protein Cni_G06621 [Canna indica]